MSGTVQIPFLLIAAALGVAVGWFAYRYYINKAFEVRQKDWRELLNHAEHEKHTLSVKKEKLEQHLIDSNKMLQEQELKMSRLEEEAKAHGQQYKDMVVAYRETFEAKEGDLTQQIDTLKAKFNTREHNDQTSVIESNKELEKINLMLEKSRQEIQELSSARQELVQNADALKAQLDGAKLENQEIMVEAERQKNKNIELQEQLDDLKLEHAKELSIARTSTDESNNEFQALKAKYNELVESSASLPDSEALQAELVSVQKKEDGLQDKIAELQEKVRHLEHESRDQITREKERANLARNELEVVKSEKNRLASQLLQLENEQATSTSNTGENEELLQDLKDLQGRFDEVKKHHEEEKRRVMLLEKDAGDINRQLKEKEIQLIQYQKASEESQQAPEHLEKIKEQQEQIENLQSQLDRVDSQDNNALKVELVELKSLLQKTNVDLELARNTASTNLKERDSFRQKHLTTVSELERLKVSGAVNQNKVLDLNKKLNPVREQELVKKHAKLDKENKVMQQQLSKLTKLENEYKVLKANIKIAENRFKLDRGEFKKELRVKENDLKSMEKKEAQLQKQIEKLKARPTVKTAAKPKKKVVRKAAVKKKVVRKKVARKKVVKKKVARKKPVKKTVRKKVVKKPAVKKKLKKAAPKKRATTKKRRVQRAGITTNDDLKRISGVGPAIEKKLHDMGIKRFTDVAGLTKKEIAEIDEKLNFKGRIQRDKWLVQARKLAKS